MRGRRALAILVAIGGMVFGALGITAMAAVPLATAADAMTPSAQRYFDRINAERASVGAPPLREDPELTALAQAWADQMASTQSPGHPPDITQGFSTPWLQVGDNFAFGPNIDVNWDQLMNSTIHRGNIRNAGYTQVGIGVAIATDGTEYVHQWFIEAEPASGGGGGSGGGGSGGGAAPSGPVVEDTLPVDPAAVGVLPAVVTPMNMAVISSLEYGKAVIPSLTYGGPPGMPIDDVDESSLSPWLIALPLALLLLLLAALLARRARRPGSTG
jgi:hypothetical protein